MTQHTLWIALGAALALGCSSETDTQENTPVPSAQAAASAPQDASETTHVTQDRDTDTSGEHGHARPALPTAADLAQLAPDGGPDWNRLVFEKSPYLLQHAANPVDWYPWGDEAFERAAAENKPVFLSVGYSTCHWCHVMERESFEVDEVGSYLNEHFISIKVDREERPDVDQFYMTVTQAMTGRGGWPMTIIMTADKTPFFSGTYFPKEGDGRRPGLMDILRQVVDVWNNDPQRISSSADAILDRVRQMSTAQPGELIGLEELNDAYTRFEATYDSLQGGFGAAPKFPVPHNLRFLLQYAHRTQQDEPLAMVTHTLDRMRLGGIWDHVGYGFHRYSTDPQWLLPHFEKMLYDQALLALTYAEAFQVTREPRYRDTAREIFTYVLRDMHHDEGGFYSAEDADSEGEEGLFYLWTPQEVVEVLGQETGDLFNRVYNIVEGGNFEDQATGQRTGDSIVHLQQPLAEIASDEDMLQNELEATLDTARRTLFRNREGRIHPLKDTKILTDWNGLMIAALARASQILDEPRYLQAAQGAADFVLARVTSDDGRLLKRYRDGEAGLPATVEDYAFFIWGLLELYEAGFDVAHLKEARRLTSILLSDFWDEENGGFFMGAVDGEKLPVRSKEVYDGAIPSGNSVAASNLQRLGRILAEPALEERAESLLKAFAGQVRRIPTGHTQLLLATDFAVGPSFEVVIAGDPARDDTRAMLQALRSLYVPNKVVLLRPDGEEAPPISRLAEYTENQLTLDGRATAYVCQNYACKRPTTDIEVMLESLAP